MSALLKPLSLSALLLLSACAVGPDPSVKPQTAVPASFAEGSARPAGDVAARAWWGDYRDRMLSDLVARGLAQNLDVMAANERIRAAAADLSATGPLVAPLGGSATSARERGATNGGAVGYSTTSSLSAAFVFDLFGGQRRARQGAEAAVRSAADQAETVRLAWLASVISAYADARFNQQALALTRETISARAGTVDITRTKTEMGSATAFELAQAEALLATARADLPGYEAQFNAQVFRLATLLDEPAGPLLSAMQRGAAPLRTPAGPGTGTPADLLRNRPDVRSAEQDLAGALAAVGVAQAAMLPSISLTGRISDVSGSQTWGFGPQLSLPVFNQGALQATRARRVSEARQAEIAWRAAVSAAVEDVQTAHSNLRRYRQRVGTLQTAAQSYDRAYDLAQQNFQAGSLSLLDLLEVDRSRAAARLAAASAQTDAAKEWAVLQIAIGAGAR